MRRFSDLTLTKIKYLNREVAFMKEKLAMLDYAKLLGHNISVNSPKKTTIEIFIDNKRSPKNLLIEEQSFIQLTITPRNTYQGK